MRLFLALIILLTFGCNKTGVFGTDTKEYDKYLTQFNDDLMSLGYPPVDFSQTQIIKTEKFKDELSADAYCPHVAVKSGGAITLFVSENMKVYSDTGKAYMIYHELGHCVLGLQHKDGNNLMSPMIGTLALWSNQFNEENRLSYLKEMLESSGFR